MTQAVLPDPDRLQKALRSVNQALNPRQVFSMVWEYRVIDATPTPPITIDCQAVDLDVLEHLPPQLVGIVLWPGPSGCIAVPKPGTIVRIGFVNGDPGKPTVIGLDPNSQATVVFLDGSPGPFVARIGDTVQIVITQAEITAAAMVAGGNPVTITPVPPLTGLVGTGTITSGSTKVQCP